jgi:hypothetical protein
MAGYDRYSDYQTRDRESSRYGRDMSDDRDRWDNDRGGRGRDSERSRGGGMFGSGRSADDEDDYRTRGRGDRDWSGGRSRHDNRDDQFGYDDRHEGLPIDETSRLIASNKVEGTAVYARNGSRLGSIYNFMVDKRSGKVEYAVMTYGGFLGMGTRYYPLPWDILEYDTRYGGYRVDMMERDLERAPSFDRHSEPDFDTSYGRRVRGWYGLST